MFQLLRLTEIFHHIWHMVAGPSCLCGSEEVHLQVEQVRRGLVWVRRWWLGGICGWWTLAAGASVFRALAGFLWLEGEECLLCVGLSASPGGSSPVFGAGISSPLPLLWPLLQWCVLCRGVHVSAFAPGGHRVLLPGAAAVTQQPGLVLVCCWGVVLAGPGVFTHVAWVHLSRWMDSRWWGLA